MTVTCYYLLMFEVTIAVLAHHDFFDYCTL